MFVMREGAATLLRCLLSLCGRYFVRVMMVLLLLLLIYENEVGV